MASRRSGLGFEAFKSGTTLVLLLKSNSPTDYIKSVHVVHPILGLFLVTADVKKSFFIIRWSLKCIKTTNLVAGSHWNCLNVIASNHFQISQETRGKFFKRLKPPSQRHCFLSMSSSLPPSAALGHFSESLLSLSRRNVPRKNLT